MTESESTFRPGQVHQTVCHCAHSRRQRCSRMTNDPAHRLSGTTGKDRALALGGTRQVQLAQGVISRAMRSPIRSRSVSRSHWACKFIQNRSEVPR